MVDSTLDQLLIFYFYISDAAKCFVTRDSDLGTLIEPGIVVASSYVAANDVMGLAFLKTLDVVQKIQEHSVWAQPQIKRAAKLGPWIRGRE